MKEARWRAMKCTQEAVKRVIWSANVRTQYGYSVNIVAVTHSSIIQPVKTELYKIARTSISFSQTDYHLHVSPIRK